MFTVFVMLVVHTKLQLHRQLYMSYKHDMLPVVSKRKGCDFLHLRKTFDLQGDGDVYLSDTTNNVSYSCDIACRRLVQKKMKHDFLH